MSRVPPMLAEHVFVERNRRLLPRAIKRHARARADLKPGQYEARAAILAQMGRAMPAYVEMARLKTLSVVRP